MQDEDTNNVLIYTNIRDAPVMSESQLLDNEQINGNNNNETIINDLSKENINIKINRKRKFQQINQSNASDNSNHKNSINNINTKSNKGNYHRKNNNNHSKDPLSKRLKLEDNQFYKNSNISQTILCELFG